MIRKGIKILCEQHLGYKGVEEVTNCNQLMRSLARTTFTHLILDINLSDGNSLEILSGINVADKLVLNPPDSLADNDAVTIVQPKAAAAKAKS